MELTMPDPPQTSRLRMLGIIFLLAAVLIGFGTAYWYFSGRLNLEGVMQNNIRSLFAGHDGIITDVGARPGAYVRQGDVLLRFDETVLRKNLADEQQKLRYMAQLVPPKLLKAPDSDEALTERHERRRAMENAAERRVQEATDKEAQASILYSRATMLATQGKLREPERSAAEAALSAARHEVLEARKAFEALSLERAASGVEIQRLRDIQSATGANKLPEATRLRNYEEQKIRVDKAQAALQTAIVNAPEDGIIVDVMVQPGSRVAAMQPCVLYLPQGQQPMVKAFVPIDASSKLMAGQQCDLTLFGPEERKADGYIASLSPGQSDKSAGMQEGAESFTTVWIELLPPKNSGNEVLSLLPDGTRASVTVLLREPKLAPQLRASRAPAPQSAPPASVSPASSPVTAPGSPDIPAAGAPSGTPMSVQNAFGQDPAQVEQAQREQMQLQPQSPPPPAVVRAGSPEATGRMPAEAATATPAARPPGLPPVLPPMQAPRQLTGSPLPNPNNNPSIVPPQILDQGAPVTP